MTRNARWQRIVGVLGLALGSLSACDRDDDARTVNEIDDLAVRVDEGSKVAVAPAEALVGVLVPKAEVVLTSPGFARLARLGAQVGDRVSEGEVVADLDIGEERNDLAEATAAWQASEAELERLELELQQARETRSEIEQLEGIVSNAELREQRYAERLAAARRRSAGASLRQQHTRIEDAAAKLVEAQLRAPFDGSISRRYVDAGATLDTGEPVVQLISDARLVRFAVPQERSGALRLGGAVRVEFIEEGLELTGEITSIAPEIDAGTRLVFVEARLTSDNGRLGDLRVGTVGRVNLADGT